MVTCPGDTIVSNCDFATQADLEAYFQNWLGQFDTLVGGCNVDGGNFADAYTAPDLCLGGTTIVVFGATDNCTTDSCTVSFTVTVSPVGGCGRSIE